MEYLSDIQTGIFLSYLPMLQMIYYLLTCQN